VRLNHRTNKVFEAADSALTFSLPPLFPFIRIFSATPEFSIVHAFLAGPQVMIFQFVTIWPQPQMLIMP